MITLLMLLAYVLPGLMTYRRVGGFIESRKEIGHDYKNVCNSCLCKTCGVRWGYHFEYRSIAPPHCCKEYVHGGNPHFATLASIVPALALWPVIVLGYYLFRAEAHLGLTEGKTFWVKPKPVESKSQRLEREALEKDNRMVALEHRNRELERELNLA